MRNIYWQQASACKVHVKLVHWSDIYMMSRWTKRYWISIKQSGWHLNCNCDCNCNIKHQTILFLLVLNINYPLHMHLKQYQINMKLHLILLELLVSIIHGTLLITFTSLQSWYSVYIFHHWVFLDCGKV